MGCHTANGAIDEGKRIVDEVLATAQQNIEEEVHAPGKSEEDIEAVDVSGSGERIASATGAESHNDAKLRRGKKE